VQALISEHPLIVYIDVKSPYAFLAIKPTIAMENALGLQFDWRPLTLDIPSYLGSAEKSGGKVVQSNRSDKHWTMVKYAYMDARRYAQRQGYVLKGTEKIWDSSLANMGILWVSQNKPQNLAQYFPAVFPPFWRRELDIEDIGVVEHCLTQAGVNPHGFAEFCQYEGRKIHDQLQSQLHPNGIFGVPTYVINDTVLFGREHLPLVRWMLTGQHGKAPDIAYLTQDARN